ncbi:hypothetical protein LCGC14_1109320 [marine sediment metagenome]|uniref:Uncharacterized protein n=1 Tax=marine sediment metagenome TaxID=412755 RepID=A0A0F9PQD0_9ZZZZ
MAERNLAVIKGACAECGGDVFIATDAEQNEPFGSNVNPNDDGCCRACGLTHYVVTNLITGRTVLTHGRP